MIHCLVASKIKKKRAKQSQQEEKLGHWCFSTHCVVSLLPYRAAESSMAVVGLVAKAEQ